MRTEEIAQRKYILPCCLSAACFGGAFLLAHLTQFGLDHAPNFHKPTTEQANEQLGSVLYRNEVQIKTKRSWGELEEIYGLSKPMVEWSYACTMNSMKENADFKTIAGIKISSGTTIQIVLRKDACKQTAER